MTEEVNVYIVSDKHGVLFVGPEGDGNEVWHEEARIEEMGVRAWAREEKIR